MLLLRASFMSMWRPRPWNCSWFILICLHLFSLHMTLPPAIGAGSAVDSAVDVGYLICAIRVESITKRPKTKKHKSFLPIFVAWLTTSSQSERERGKLMNWIERISRMNSFFIIYQNRWAVARVNHSKLEWFFATGGGRLSMWLGLVISAICIFVAPSICKSIRCFISVMDLSLMLKSSSGRCRRSDYANQFKWKKHILEYNVVGIYLSIRAGLEQNEKTIIFMISIKHDGKRDNRWSQIKWSPGASWLPPCRRIASLQVTNSKNFEGRNAC